MAFWNNSWTEPGSAVETGGPGNPPIPAPGGRAGRGRAGGAAGSSPRRPAAARPSPPATDGTPACLFSVSGINVNGLWPHASLPSKKNVKAANRTPDFVRRHPRGPVGPENDAFTLRPFPKSYVARRGHNKMQWPMQSGFRGLAWGWAPYIFDGRRAIDLFLLIRGCPIRPGCAVTVGP
jgi:hypothetical protein